MNVLFTNHRLVDVGGAETSFRDLAVALRRRGHGIVGFSSFAAQDESLAAAGVTAITALRDLPWRPDVIHGQHHVDAMAAIMALPGVPAIYVCHGATRADAQPRHPRIFRYVAMSGTLRLRMAVESNIPEGMIEVVPNPVNLGRFREVRVPPERPRRAFVYSRVVTPANRLGAAIAAAALRTGLEIEFLRMPGGRRRIADPEAFLLGYDLVFASGRSAIDAMACGCAVIVLGGATGGWAAVNCGELVDETSFARLREANFTIPVNAPPPSVDAICAEIRRYTAAGALAVSRRIRAVAGLDAYVDRFLDIYARATAAGRASKPDPRSEQRAACDYLRSIAGWAMLADAARTDPRPPRGTSVSDDWAPPRLVSRPLLVDDVRRRLAAMDRE
jgi:hypothetical protein